MPINPATQELKTITDAVDYLRQVVRRVFDVPGDHSGIHRLQEITKMERGNLRPVEARFPRLYAEAQIAKWMIEGAMNPHRPISEMYGLRFPYIGAVILGADSRNIDALLDMGFKPEHIDAARKMLEVD